MSSRPVHPSLSGNARSRPQTHPTTHPPPITQAELELFLLAQRKAQEAKEAFEAIEQRILSRFAAGARIEPGVHAPKLGLIVK